MNMRQLDFYEFAGVIAPGTVAIVGAGLIWPDHLGKIHALDVSLGGFGIAVILAYVVGHLLQSIGNVLESAWWKLFGGWPSDWPLSNKGALLSSEQRKQLQGRIQKELGFPEFTFDQSRTSKEWHPVFRQIYAVVRAAGRDERAHTFNGNYGMFRGVAAAAFVIAIAALLAKGFHAWPLALTFSIAGALAVARMHRFAKHYATETFVQFLSLSSATEKEK